MEIIFHTLKKTCSVAYGEEFTMKANTVLSNNTTLKFSIEVKVEEALINVEYWLIISSLLCFYDLL